MSNFQRGIYRPLADMVPIYHLADKDPEERSRAPLLVIIVLVVLSAFAGVVWLAYNRVERGHQDVSLVITAPSPAVPDPRPRRRGGPPSSLRGPHRLPRLQ